MKTSTLISVVSLMASVYGQSVNVNVDANQSVVIGATTGAVSATTSRPYPPPPYIPSTATPCLECEIKTPTTLPTPTICLECENPSPIICLECEKATSSIKPKTTLTRTTVYTSTVTNCGNGSTTPCTLCPTYTCLSGSCSSKSSAAVVTPVTPVTPVCETCKIVTSAAPVVTSAVPVQPQTTVAAQFKGDAAGKTYGAGLALVCALAAGCVLV